MEQGLCLMPFCMYSCLFLIMTLQVRYSSPSPFHRAGSWVSQRGGDHSGSVDGSRFWTKLQRPLSQWFPSPFCWSLGTNQSRSPTSWVLCPSSFDNSPCVLRMLYPHLEFNLHILERDSVDPWLPDCVPWSFRGLECFPQRLRDAKPGSDGDPLSFPCQGSKHA